MFQLTDDEIGALRSRSAISKGGRGGRRYRPYVLTEQGVAMLSSVPRRSDMLGEEDLVTRILEGE